MWSARCHHVPHSVSGYLDLSIAAPIWKVIHGMVRTPSQLLFLLVFAATLLTSRGLIVSSDGRSMYEVAKSIVDEHDVSIERGVTVAGRNGASYSPYGLGLSLASLGPYLVARTIAEAFGLRPQLAETAVASMMPVIVGLLAVALFQLGQQLGGGVVTSLLIALGSIFGTYLVPYTKDFFSEPLATLFVVVAVYQMEKGKGALAAWALAGAAITRPQFLALYPLFWWVLWRHGGGHAGWRSGTPLVLAVLLTLSYNYLRFGQLTEFGYAGQGFTTPLLTGMRGLLFHPQKSVFLFAPVVIALPFAFASLRRPHPAAFWFLVGNLAITFGISAMWWAWGGGWVWGPRLLLPAVIPAMAVLAPWLHRGPRWRTLLVALTLIAGFLVSAPMMVVPHGAQLATVEGEGPIGEGPGIPEQYRLIGPTVSQTFASVDTPVGSLRELDQVASLWQIVATKELGRTGSFIAVSGSLILLAIVVRSGICLGRSVQAVLE